MTYLSKWREILIIILSATTYYFYTSKMKPLATEVTHVVVQEETLSKKHQVKQVVIVTKPDGTKTQTTTVTTDKEITKEKSTVADKTTTVTVTPNLSKWSLGITYDLPTNLDTWRQFDYKIPNVEVARRLGSSDLWVLGTYSFKDGAVALGLRIDF